MGIYLCVISSDRPFPTTVGIVDNYPGSRGAIRRLQRSVGSGESIASVVQRIRSSVDRFSLDAMLIFAHGLPNRAESLLKGFTVPTFQLGTGLTSATAVAFSAMRDRWRVRYDPAAARTSDFRTVIPRIELHICYAAEVWNRPIVLALANAASAPVFASGILQTVDNLGFEGSVSRFDPRGGGLVAGGPVQNYGTAGAGISAH